MCSTEYTHKRYEYLHTYIYTCICTGCPTRIYQIRDVSRDTEDNQSLVFVYDTQQLGLWTTDIHILIKFKSFRKQFLFYFILHNINMLMF